MNISDSTILRIKVPAHLYESVKEQLLIKEGKGDNGMPGSTVIKEKKTGDKPASKKSAPKKPAGEKKASTPKDGHKKVEEDKEKPENTGADHGPDKMTLSVEDMKKMYEILGRKLEEMGAHGLSPDQEKKWSKYGGYDPGKIGFQDPYMSDEEIEDRISILNPRYKNPDFGKGPDLATQRRRERQADIAARKAAAAANQGLPNQ